MAVSRIHSSNSRIYIENVTGTSALKGITKYDFSFDQDITNLQGLGDYQITEKIKNPNQKVDFSLSWILSTGSNDPFYDFYTSGFLSTEKFNFTIKDLVGSNFISGAYLTNYSISASVGELIEGSLKYEADGIFYSTGNKILISDQTNDSFNPILPSKLEVSFTNSGNVIAANSFPIQSFSFDIPIERKPITQLGQKVPTYRYPQLPITAPIKFSVVKTDITGINFSNLLLPKTDISLKFKDCQLKGYQYDFDKCFLKSISESLGIDGNAQLDFAYEFSLNDYDSELSRNSLSPSFFWKNWTLTPSYTPEGTAVFSTEGNNLKIFPRNGLTTFSAGYGYNGGAIDASKCLNLTDLSCPVSSLTSIDVSRCRSLTDLSCYSNSLILLDVSKCKNLSTLNCANNQLTSLDVSGLKNLFELQCPSNTLTSLDLLGCTNLFTLNCSYNSLTSLDCSSLTNVSSLNCGYNSLISLDVYGLKNLFELQCNYNSLTSLDISKCENLSILSCTQNVLISLNIENCQNIISLSAYANALSYTSIDDILVKLNSFGLTGGGVILSGGDNSPPSIIGSNAKTSLQGKSWYVETN